MERFSLRGLQTSLRRDVRPKYQVVIRNLSPRILMDLEGFKQVLMTDLHVVSFGYQDDGCEKSIIVGLELKEYAQELIEVLHQQEPDYLEATFFKGNHAQSLASSMVQHPLPVGLSFPLSRGLGRGRLHNDTYELNFGRGIHETGPAPCFECRRPARFSCESCRKLFCSAECSNSSEKHNRICPNEMPAIPRELPVIPRGSRTVSRESAFIASPPPAFPNQQQPAIPGAGAGPTWSGPHQPTQAQGGTVPGPFSGSVMSWPQQQNQMPSGNPPGWFGGPGGFGPHQNQQMSTPAQQAYPNWQPPPQGWFPPQPQLNGNVHPGNNIRPAGPTGSLGTQSQPNRSNFQPTSRQETGTRPRQHIDQHPKEDGDRRGPRQFREDNQPFSQSSAHKDGFKSADRFPVANGGAQQQQHGFKPNQDRQAQSASQYKRPLLPNPTSPPRNQEKFNKPADKPSAPHDPGTFKFKPRGSHYDEGSTRQSTNEKSYEGGIQAKFNKGEPRGNLNTGPRKPEFSRKNTENNYGNQSKGQGFVKAKTGASVSDEWDQDEETSTPISYGKSYSKGVVSLPGEPVDVVLSWICSPEKIFVQVNSMEEDVNAVNSKLAASVEKAPPIGNVAVGLPCAAPYEGTWFRGLVRKILDDGSLAVFFVDYGNTEKISRGSAKQLEQGLCAAPFYAVELELADVKPVQDKWEPSVNDFMADQVAGKGLTLKVVGKNHDGRIVADLLVNGKKSLREIMIAQGVARAAKTQGAPVEAVSPPPRSNETSAPEQQPVRVGVTSAVVTVEKPEVPARQTPKIAEKRNVAPGKAWVGIVVSPHDIRIQCSTPQVEQDLGKVTTVLEEAVFAKRPQLKDAEVGDFYACLFEDGLWYRAQVKGRTGPKFQVYLIDYGNDYEASVDDLRALPSELLNIAPCCSKLQLSRVDLVPEAAAVKAMTILEPIIDQYVEIKAIIKETGAVTVVELEQNDVSINKAVLDAITPHVAASVPAATPAAVAAAAAVPTTLPAAAAVPTTLPAAVADGGAVTVIPTAEIPAPEAKIEKEAPPYAGEEWTCVKVIYKSSEVASLPLNQEIEIAVLNGSEAPFFLHFCAFDPDLFGKLAELQGEIYNYCKMPLLPHKPAALEVCLVEHPEEEGGWGRACRIDEDDETFFYLLDKGEGVFVRPERVRRIPRKFLELPYAAHSGVLKGYEKMSEEDVDAEIVSKLKEILKTSAVLKATVTEGNPLVLDIPEAAAAVRINKNN